ncbi:MAG: hypothetical protein UHG91_04440 [Succinivibrionaceae bacterium]|nr:hypothetical protein [Succinivibrionaceae bacterium]
MKKLLIVSFALTMFLASSASFAGKIQAYNCVKAHGNNRYIKQLTKIAETNVRNNVPQA